VSGGRPSRRKINCDPTTAVSAADHSSEGITRQPQEPQPAGPSAATRSSGGSGVSVAPAGSIWTRGNRGKSITDWLPWWLPTSRFFRAHAGSPPCAQMAGGPVLRDFRTRLNLAERAGASLAVWGSRPQFSKPHNGAAETPPPKTFYLTGQPDTAVRVVVPACRVGKVSVGALNVSVVGSLSGRKVGASTWVTSNRIRSPGRSAHWLP
jgi:hypothetical protein